MSRQSLDGWPLPRRTRSRRILLVALALTAPSVALRGQECPDLPPPQAPQLKTCSRLDRINPLSTCTRDNDAKTAWYERQTKRFNLGVAYNSSDADLSSLRVPDLARLLISKGDDQAQIREAVDSLVGCRGESVRLTIVPARVDRLEYQLRSPSDVVVLTGERATTDARPIDLPPFVLTESGKYHLVVRTTAMRPVVNKDKTGKVVSTSYPRVYAFSFRSDASVAACRPGDQMDGSAMGDQPFRRRMAVKAGEQASVRLTSVNGDFVATFTAMGDGRAIGRSNATREWQSPSFTAQTDDDLLVEARPAVNGAAVGLRLSCDGKAGSDAGAPSAWSLGTPLTGGFRLRPGFDASRPEDERLAQTMTVQRVLPVKGPATLSLAATASALRGLTMHVVVYDRTTQRVALDRVVGPGDAQIPLSLQAAGDWVLEVSPVKVQRLPAEEDVKYMLELRAAAAGAPTRRPDTER
jgi:hypothetical protein